MQYLIKYFMSLQLPRSWIVFFLSMLPISELRGGIIAAKLMNMNMTSAFMISLIGNLLPIPFILLFVQFVFSVLKKFNFFKPLIVRLENAALHKAKSMEDKQLLGLFLFVAIPLPGTGAWTGALIASLLNMPIAKSFFSIFFGVVFAGLLMITISYFIPGLFGF